MMKKKTELIYPSGTSAPDMNIDVIVMAGQSNMEGGNASSSLPAPYSDIVKDAIMFLKVDDTSTTENGKTSSLLYGVNQCWRTTHLNTIGPEMSFGDDFTSSTGRKVLIIKYAYSGSMLVDDLTTVRTNGLWDYNADPSRTGPPGQHYYIMRDAFTIPAILRIKAMSFIPRLIGFCWCQGEADSQVLYCATNYETKLKQLIDNFKTELSPYIDVSTMQTIITRVHNNFTDSRPYLSTIRTALVNVANYYGSNGHWIDSDAYALEADNTHWTKAGQVTHGLDISSILKIVYP